MTQHESARQTARGWVRLASRDHAAAATLAATGEHAATAAYLAQQAVEKALKAVIIADERVPPFVHSITTLLAALPDEVSPPEAISQHAPQLNSAYLDSRYDPWLEQPVEAVVQTLVGVAAEAIAWAEQQIN